MTREPQEVEEVTSLKVSCKGSSKDISEGHPKVWLKISLNVGVVTCPYCEKTFVLKKN